MASSRDVRCNHPSDDRRRREQLGFETRTFYQMFEREGRAATDADRTDGDTIDARVRRFTAADLAAAARLDAIATAEDRSGVLAAMTDEVGALALAAPDGTLEGFVLRAPWGGGATVATSTDAALRLLDARRLRAGPGHLVRIGTLQENLAGIAALEAAGWRPTHNARRMELGRRLDWRPDWLWGQFNMALG